VLLDAPSVLGWAAMSIANADDPEQEKADVRAVIHNLIDALLSNPDRAASARVRP
jgi:hypothetical protein